MELFLNSSNITFFSNLREWETDFGFQLVWHFFATSHGKGTCCGWDRGNIETVCIRRVVRAGANSLVDAASYAEIATQRNPNINVVFIHITEEVKSQVDNKLAQWDVALAIPNTPKCHCFSALIFIETCSVKTCLIELIQLEHNLMRFINKMAASDALLSAAESSKEAIQITNSNNQIQYVNKAYEKLSGFKKVELIGSNIQQIFGLDSSKFESSSTESNGKNWEGFTEVKRKSGEVIAVDYRLISSSESRNPSHIIYVNGSISRANKSCNTDAPFGVPMFVRRQSVAKLHAMTIEAPITKVIKIITAVSENSPPEISDSLEAVLDILRSTELYNPQHLTNQSMNPFEDQTTSDLVGGLMLQDAKKPTHTIYRRQSQESSSMKVDTYAICYLRRLTFIKIGQNQSGGLQLIADFESAPSSLKSVLEKESQWDFDVIELEKLTSKRPLVWLGMTIFEKFQVSYHNSTHAADVLQATAYFLRLPRIKMMLDPMDEVACFIAAIVHDVDHPGKTSAFLSNSSSELAILYNDLSVLESHHSAHAFRLTTTNDKVNIFQNLDRETYRSLRKSIVDMVLATEIAKHFEHLTNFVKKFLEPALDIPETSPSEIFNVQEPEPLMESLITPENVVLVKRILIKCADVNNPLRPWNLCRKWAIRIAEEYFAQTDEEKRLNLPVVMPAFDRTTCNIAASQIVFIDIFINDMFTSWNAFIEMPQLMENLKNNYSYWKERDKTSSSPSPKQYSQPPELSDVEEINLEKD
ncbi:High affinity cAMP-specific and IBMX-insensitive 3',5'-cyclic phosphodiesterase 8B [Nymphon striatum]|nr:High affinity cAMP-specific and IBMX-insensitive 3',5'-cyclic phosphodiesterase 8B [Nymphon striatum]